VLKVGLINTGMEIGVSQVESEGGLAVRGTSTGVGSIVARMTEGSDWEVK
jgi:hypothetical protein